MLQTNDAISNSFQLLLSTVRDLHANGRPRLGASLKLALRRRTNNTFSEQLLGFPRFGDFLRAAERAGVVQLVPSPGGDIEVWPIGIRPPEPVTSPSLAAHSSSFVFPQPPNPVSTRRRDSVVPLRVRQDLWNAFNSFSIQWVYDRVHDIAYKALGPTAAADSSPSLSANLVQIPSGRQRVTEWMRAFAQTQDPTTKNRLLVSLDGDSAPYHFNNNVAADFRLRKAWRNFHIQQVLTAIDEWASSNNLQPKDIKTSYFTSQTTYSTITPVSQVAAQDSLQIAQSVPRTVDQPLTPRLKSLIDELIDELLRLRGTLELVEPKEKR